MVSRARKKFLFPYEGLTSQQLDNARENISEMEAYCSILKSYPRRIVLELTNACNMNCKMCGRNYSDFQIMNLPYGIIQWLCQAFDKSEEVTLMGWGEPTLYPDFIHVLSLLDKYPVKKYICTNGMRIKEIKQFLFDYHVDLFAISINGIKKETNDSVRVGSRVDEIFEEIQKMTDYKERMGWDWPYISLVFCLSAGNVLDLYKLANIAKSLRINRIKIVFLTAFEKTQEQNTILTCITEVDKAFQFLGKECNVYGIDLELPFLPGTDPAGKVRHHECVLPWRDFFVGSDGWVRPCMSTSDKLFSIDTSKCFMDYWNGEEFQMYRRIVNDDFKMSNSCYYCYQASFCNWNMQHAFYQYGHNSIPEWRIR